MSDAPNIEAMHAVCAAVLKAGFRGGTEAEMHRGEEYVVEQLGQFEIAFVDLEVSP